MEAGAVLAPDVLETDVIGPLDAPETFEDKASLNRAPDRGGYACVECGHVMRMFGGGRHRIYFEVSNPAFDDPIMDGKCPACGHSLPGKQ